MSLPRCFGNWLIQKVDAGDPPASSGEEKSVLTGAATGIEYRAGDLVRRPNERALWLADVPGRLTPLHFLELLFVGHVAHGCLLAGALVQ